jgi:transcriptional regulator
VYVPRHFADDDRERLHALIRAHGFATLVSVVDDEPYATHVPLLLDAGRGPQGTLLGHVARSNPHWRTFDGRRPALAIFHGPHAYVSPRWYRAAGQPPTWNYVVVHAHGAPRVVDDAARVRALLARTAAQYEAGAEAPWDPAGLPERVADGLQRAIVAFELPIERLTGKRKLSQNKAPADRAGVVAGLRAAGGEASLSVAAEMEREASA